jgi:hypothetical protein
MVNEVQAIDHKTIKTSYYVWQNLCVSAIGVCNESIECNSVGVCDKANAWGNGRQSSSERTLGIIWWNNKITTLNGGNGVTIVVRVMMTTS